jgi:hypothetical protein
MGARSMAVLRKAAQPTHSTLRVQRRPARSIFSNALNFCRSAIAALVRSPWRYCPFRAPGGAPLPLAPRREQGSGIYRQPTNRYFSGGSTSCTQT